MTAIARPPASLSTIPGSVRDRALASPDTVSMRVKKLGIWREITWGEYWDQVQTAACRRNGRNFELGVHRDAHRLTRQIELTKNNGIVKLRGINNCQAIRPCCNVGSLACRVED